MAKRMDPIPHNTYLQERKPETMSELQNYQSNKSPKQSDAEGSTEPNKREG